MILLYGHLACALLTWVALVADGMRRWTPRAFWKALASDVRIFGAWRVMLWFFLCLTAWWLIWLAWGAEALSARR